MRIVYIAKTNVPSRAANSIHIMKMCQAFAKNGHEVLLLIPDWSWEREENIADVYKFYNVEKNFKIKKLPWVFLPGRDYVFSLIAVFNAMCFKADFVYGRYIHGCYFASLFGFPTVYEDHHSLESVSSVRFGMFTSMLKRKSFKRAVVISRSLKDYFVNKLSIHPDKVFVAHDGADEFKGSSLKKASARGRLQAGYIGHLYPGKGMEIIVPLAGKCPDVDFHVIGGREEDINAWKPQAAGSKNLVFHGFVPQSELGYYFDLCDVFLAPYQREVKIIGKMDVAKWMSPLKIFEYMSAGKPIIASDLAVLREVLNESNALLAEPDDIGQWAEAIKKAKDPQVREKLSAQALKDFNENYTWDRRARKVIEGI